MKKILSIVLTVAMLASMLTFATITASAEEITAIPDGFTYAGNTTDPAEINNRFAYTDEQASDGNYSLKIKNFGTPVNEFTHLKQAISGAEGEYKVSMDVYGVPTGSLGVWFKIFDSDGNQVSAYDTKEIANKADVTKSGEPAEGQWTTYSWTVTFKPLAAQLEIYESTGEFYIDNIKIEDAEGKNLLKNASFESFPRENTIPAGTLPEGYTPAAKAGAPYTVEEVMSVVNNRATDGENSLKVSNIGVPNNIQWYLRPSFQGKAPAGKYTFSIKIFNNPSVKLGLSLKLYCTGDTLETNLGDIKWGGDYTINDLGDGWYEYTKEFECLGDFRVFDFQIYESAGEFWIDELSIKDAAGNEYISNGSFEVIPRVNTIKENQLPSAFNLSWAGNGDEATASTVYDLVNNTSFSGVNSVKVNNIGILSNHQYYLNPTINKTAEGGKYELSIKTKGTTYASIGTKFILKDSLGTDLLEKDTKWVNGTNEAQGVYMTNVGNGWYEYKWVVDSPNGIGSLQFAVYETNKEIYIDDLTVKLVDGGENLVVNGDFEKMPMAANTLPDGFDLTGKGVSDYKTGNYFTVSDDMSYDGDYVVKVTNKHSGWANQEVNLVHTLAETAPKGTYTLSIVTKETTGGPCVSVGTMGGTGEMRFQYSSDVNKLTKESLEKGWARYSIEVTAEDHISSVWVKVYEPASMYIDCFSLKDEAGKEYVTNGSFENYTISQYSVTNIKVENLDYSVDASNVSLEDGLNVAVIVTITDVIDPEVCYFKKMNAVKLEMGEADTVKVSIPEEEFPFDYIDQIEIKAFAWDPTNLKPYYPAYVFAP